MSTQGILHVVAIDKEYYIYYPNKVREHLIKTLIDSIIGMVE
jgi:hypothetical protein